MNKSITFTFIGILLAVVAVAAAPQDKKSSVFAPLEKGQKVALKETANGFEIGVMPGIDLGYTIKEVGQDFLVIEDIAGITETRIPIYSVKAVKITRLPKK